MKLHVSMTSPYVRKPRMLLRETGLDARVAEIPETVSPVEPNAQVAALNPLGKIPCLERPEGPALFDSRVICRYLDTLHDGAKFYPAGDRVWTTLTLEALADGMMDALVLCRYEVVLRPEAARSQSWVDGQMLKVRRGLDALESQWLAHLNGPLDAGGLAVGVMLGYVDYRYADLRWRDGRPGLAAWHADFAARPSYAATTPPA